LTWIVSLTLITLPISGALAQMVSVVEAVVCQEIVDRAPVGISDAFPAGIERVFCFTRIDAAEGETAITHNWYHQGTLKASVVLPVRAKHWRTWSSKSLLPEWTGEWMVEVLSQDGTPLESIVFTVK
jgi:hypothetical protein